VTDLATFVAEIQRHFPGAAVTRFVTILNSPRDRNVAKQAIDRAPQGYALEIREAKRTDSQNRALWSALNQIARQRPTHNGVKMDAELYKAVFMNALGVEMRMLPNLDGDGFFPLGHRSSQLTKSEFADLLELILCWAAREGVTITHFDHCRDADGPNKPAALAG
jgi:hypothetical protein